MKARLVDSQSQVLRGPIPKVAVIQAGAPVMGTNSSQRDAGNFVLSLKDARERRQCTCPYLKMRITASTTQNSLENQKIGYR